MEDDDLLGAATRDGRALDTENAKACDAIVRAWAGRNEHYAGAVFTSPRRYQFMKAR